MTLAIKELTARRGAFTIGPTSVQLERGDCLALMGANGAGKTTFLETIAGFLAATSGHIQLDSLDVTHRVPERRRIAYLPQDLALFPHLDVMHNVSFAAKREKSRAWRDEISALIEEFGLESIRDRYPSQLSRGQAQRVAFARAVAAHPTVLLLDEPTTNLDIHGQRSFHAHMRKLLDDHQLIIIYATHNILDSLSLATHAIVFDQGQTIQCGAPNELFQKPADVRVAELLGVTNLWPAEIVRATASATYIRTGGHELSCTQRPVPPTPVFVGIGPGEVELLADTPADATNCFKAVIQALQISGRLILLELEGGLSGLCAVAPPRQAHELTVGQVLWVRLAADRLRLMPAPRP